MRQTLRKDSPLEALRLGQQPTRRGAAKPKHAAEKPLLDALVITGGDVLGVRTFRRRDRPGQTATVR
jgi:hypothetical protein